MEHGPIRMCYLLLPFLGLLGACRDSSENNLSGAPSNNASKRSMVVEGLADPDVLKVDDNRFFLSGTGTHPGSELPIYESNDLETFRLKLNYRPSDKDPKFNYCDLWAPDISLKNGIYTYYFSARRVPKGQACKGVEVATYIVTTTNPNLDFGAPRPVLSGASGSRTVVEGGCPSDGCNKAIRIDAEVFRDGDTSWLFYVWFDRGNNISSYPMNDSRKILVDNTGPARFSIADDEEKINEGPAVFKRGSKYYLFYSTGFFNSQYAMHYIMGDSLDQLTHAKKVYRNSKAVRGGAGQLVESHGHNSIVERKGVYYNFFHQGTFKDGKYTGKRSTYKQPMYFNNDGTIATLNLVDLKWTKKNNAQYSIDLKLRSGEVVGPCLGAGTIGQATATTFNTICPGAKDRLVRKDEIAAFRLYWSDDGKWGKNMKELPYDGYSDSLNFNL